MNRVKAEIERQKKEWREVAKYHSKNHFDYRGLIEKGLALAKRNV